MSASPLTASNSPSANMPMTADTVAAPDTGKRIGVGAVPGAEAVGTRGTLASVAPAATGMACTVANTLSPGKDAW